MSCISNADADVIMVPAATARRISSSLPLFASAHGVQHGLIHDPKRPGNEAGVPRSGPRTAEITADASKRA
jgi:hypothetical protein